MQKERILVLDGLRGWAAICVAFMHFPIDELTHRSGLIAHSYLAVDLFFVLSGFVIAHIYQGTISRKRFLIARGARLLPLYYLTLGIAVALEFLKSVLPFVDSQSFSAPNTPDGLVREFLLIHVIPIFNNTSFNPPNWSVAVECFMYVVFALMSLIQNQNAKVMIWCVIGVFGSVMVLSAPSVNNAHELAVARGLSGFSAGVITFHVWQYIRAVRLSKLTTICVFLAGLLYISQGGSHLLPPAVVFSVLIIAMLLSESSCMVNRALRSQISVYLGTVSYTVYMIHFFIAMRFEELYRFVPDHILSQVILLTMYLVITIGIAHLIYHLYEWPARMKLRGWRINDA